MSEFVSVKVWGPMACFTRPELKVERLSYPMMTPSAARGLLDAILWKPQMVWHVRRIHVLRTRLHRTGPPRLFGVRRNEIQGKISPRVMAGFREAPESFAPYYVDSASRDGIQGENRTQRNTLLLRDVCYRIDATPRLTERANQPRRRQADEDEPTNGDTIAKYVGMFQRRVRKGQCFHRPYLGCREFAADFAPVDGDEQGVDWSEGLGLMLYDLQHLPDGSVRSGFFHASVRDGVLHCDTLDASPSGEAPVTVLGWDLPSPQGDNR